LRNNTSDKTKHLFVKKVIKAEDFIEYSRKVTGKPAKF